MPVQCALPRLLEIGAVLRERLRARVQENRRQLEAIAQTPGSGCEVLASEGGWTALLRLPTVMDDEEWALTLLERDGVLVQPGYLFDLELESTLVVSLLPPPEVFADGMRRLVRRVAAS
jgi:aspartate/methionine/tyrosine aminotransferase